MNSNSVPVWVVAAVAGLFVAADTGVAAPPATDSEALDQLTLDGAVAAPAISARGRFDTLSAAASFYDKLAQENHWRALKPAPLLRLGDKHPQVPLIRQRLWRLGDLSLSATTDAASERFDWSLHEAVVRFQERHGAKVDGIVGSETRAMLNVSPTHRAKQLRLNLERQSMLAGAMRGRYVHVNLPDFRLRYVDDGGVRLEMKTIVGRRARPSPELSSEIRTLVVNPAWNVPRTIAFEDILPRWEEEADYLRTQNLQVVKGWGKRIIEVAVEGPDRQRLYRWPDYLRFRQPPGDDNALGRLKFDFPNDHSVYMHDTPDKKLFEGHRRAFSSGCIRLEQPRRLADLLLAGDTQNAERFQVLMAQERTRHLRLGDPVPLFITYWTAWLDAAGILQFRRDLYRWDRAAIAKRRGAGGALTLGQR